MSPVQCMSYYVAAINFYREIGSGPLNSISRGGDQVSKQMPKQLHRRKYARVSLLQNPTPQEYRPIPYYSKSMMQLDRTPVSSKQIQKLNRGEFFPVRLLHR